MTIYYGKSDGIYNFHDSSFGKIPDEAIEVSKEQHSKLVHVRNKGANLFIEDGEIVAKSHDGDVIDINNLNGKEVFYKPLSFSEKAKSELKKAREYVYNNYGILNEPTPDEWVSYLRNLMAVSKNDSGIETLPDAPDIVSIP